MKKEIAVILSGTVVLFLWNAISWMVLPFHANSFSNIPESAIEKIEKNISEAGVYHYPGLPEGGTQSDWQKLNEKFRRGPVISLLVYNPAGTDPMSPSNYVFGLFFNLLSVALVFYLLKQIRTGKYINKVVFVGLLGLFASIVVPLAESVWFGYPPSYTFSIILDLIIGWTLVGLVLGRFTFTGAEKST